VASWQRHGSCMYGEDRHYDGEDRDEPFHIERVVAGSLPVFELGLPELVQNNFTVGTPT
jgi:hypothetical protein